MVSTHIDLLVLNELSPFVEWEQDLNWLPLPAEELRLRSMDLPERWIRALAAPGTAAQHVSALWSGLEPMLPRTCKVFAEKVFGLALLRTRQRPASLVYVFASGGELIARRGFVPGGPLPPIAARFTTDLAPLYELHDGLIHLMSYDGGPLPTAEWKTLVDQDTQAPTLVKIATDGADAFGFDVSESPCIAYALSPTEDDVSVVTDPWAFIDDLLAGRIEDL